MFFDPSTYRHWYYILVGSLVGDTTGTITVNGGNQSYLKIRDASGGGGSEVGDITMTTDESLTLYAAVYDADNNYLQDVSVDWTNTGNLDAVSSLVLLLHLTRPQYRPLVLYPLVVVH